MLGRRNLAAGYLVAQALAVVVWWLALLLLPTVRGWFELDGDREVVSAFVVGDLVVLSHGGERDRADVRGCAVLRGL